MLHVFPFSAREGTLAYKMKDQIDPRIKKERARTLIELSKKLWEEYTDRFIGKEVDVLLENYEPNENMGTGHTSNYIHVLIKGCIAKPGDIIRVKLEKSMILSE